MDADPIACRYAFRVRDAVTPPPARARGGVRALGLVAAVLLGGAPLSACSHAADTATPAPSSASATPGPADVTTVPLTVYGITDGPPEFRLPAGLVVLDVLDQPNVVTLVMGPDAGPTLAAWLRQHLASFGYRVDAASRDSVVFSGRVWSGAFTSDRRLSGLTLRRNR